MAKARSSPKTLCSPFALIQLTVLAGHNFRGVSYASSWSPCFLRVTLAASSAAVHLGSQQAEIQRQLAEAAGAATTADVAPAASQTAPAPAKIAPFT